MILFPNAKINLGLRITSRRPDGYHDIVTVMTPVPWCDILELTPGTADSLTVSGRMVDCPQESNLVWRAKEALRRVAGFGPVDIRLHKVIPDGAGLGGGSADAAFTLVGLNELFGLGLDKETLAGIAAGIGADCPLFIYNEPMLATGIGTDLAPLGFDPLEGLAVAIVKPRAGVGTREAYSRIMPRPGDDDMTAMLRLPADEWRGQLGNDFEASVFPQVPECAAIKDGLYRLGARYASMSGSGSAVYGLFAIGTTDKLADRLRQAYPDCDIFVSHEGVN